MVLSVRSRLARVVAVASTSRICVVEMMLFSKMGTIGQRRAVHFSKQATDRFIFRLYY